MHWRLLFIGLLLSTLLALIFVKFILLLGLREQLNLVIPLLPVFYALIFPLLEKSYTPRKIKSLSRSLGRTPHWWSGKLIIIFTGVICSVFIYMALEAEAWMTHRLLVLGHSWPSWQELSLGKILRWVRGDLVRLPGLWQFTFLILEMLIVSSLAGLCVGFLSGSNPLLNGLLTGVIVSIWMGSNQFTPIYERLSNWSWELGFNWYQGMLLGLLLQVFLFALWSGLGFRYKSSK